MAVNVSHGLGGTSAGFALSYAAIRFLLVIEYVRIGRRIPSTKPLTERYSVGFASQLVLWTVSAFTTSFTIHFMGNRLDYRFHNTIFGWTVSHQVRTSYIPFTRADGTFVIIALGESI